MLRKTELQGLGDSALAGLDNVPGSRVSQPGHMVFFFVFFFLTITALGLTQPHKIIVIAWKGRVSQR